MEKCTFLEFVWIWNRHQGVETPLAHRRICRWLNARWSGGDTRLLLMAFRAAGKSTLVGLFCAWLLGRDRNLRILVLAAEQDLATRMVRNVKRVLERHPLTHGLKPERSDQWAADRFTIDRDLELRDPSMMARGISANLTGSRADVIVFDDVEVPNTCDTAPKRSDLRERLAEADYILVPGGTQIYVGTPHTYHTIYAEKALPELGETQAFLAGFLRFEMPILKADGSSSWPERYDREAVESIRRRHGDAKFQSQMMLKPVASGDIRLDPGRMRLYDARLELLERNGEAVLMLDDIRMRSASAWWDPAYGAKGAGDASVVACVFTGDDGLYRLHRVLYLETDPGLAMDEARQQCRAVVRFARRNFLPSVTIETNGIGRFLPGLLRSEMAACGVACAVREHHSSKSKETRILEAFDASLAASQILCHTSVWDTAFPAEMREWRPDGTAARDDGLDAVAGCLLMEPVRLPRHGPVENRKNWRGHDHTVLAPSEFSV